MQVCYNSRVGAAGGGGRRFTTAALAFTCSAKEPDAWQDGVTQTFTRRHTWQMGMLPQ